MNILRNMEETITVLKESKEGKVRKVNKPKMLKNVKYNLST